VLERDVGRGGLRARRTLSLAVIAQTPGEVTLAGIEVPWWNVTEQRWEIAALPPRTLHFAPSSESAAPAPPAPQPLAATTGAAPPQSRFWPILSAVLAAGWLATLGAAALLWRRSRAPASAQAQPSAPRPAGAAQIKHQQRLAIRTLRAACHANDGQTARTALLQWAAVRFPDAPPRSLGALASLLPPSLALHVLDLEAHLYGGLPGPWDGQGLSGALAALDNVGDATSAPKDDGLLPLYR
jgi:hypothetical protein